ncbi:MAG: hypothetical protein Q8J89_08980 [Caulobacter sp.]|nr:hypothetical protein [Caulobacter sp.]
MIYGWRKAAAPLAIALGPTVIIVAILRNWHGWEAPPFWLDDYAAGIGLLGAGIFSIRDQDSIRGRLLSAALALSVGVMWASLFEPLAGLYPAPSEWSAFPATSRILTLACLAASVAGLLLSLPSKRPPFVGTRPDTDKRKGRR